MDRFEGFLAVVNPTIESFPISRDVHPPITAAVKVRDVRDKHAFVGRREHVHVVAVESHAEKVSARADMSSSV